MSIRVDTLSKRLTATGLTGVSTSGIPMLCAWLKHSGSSHSGLVSYGAFLGATANATDSFLALCVDATPNSYVYYKSSTNSLGSGVAGTWTDSVWKFRAFAWGPHDGSSHNLWRYNDGTESSTTSTATVNHTTNLDEFCVGNRYGSAGTLFDGWIAECSLWVPSSYAQAKSICDAMWNSGSGFRAADHATVAAIASPVHYWEMLSALTATAGGVTLTNVGTSSFDAGDHPSVDHGSGGGGGSLITSTCFMHRETPQQQARRLGFSGWRGAVEL